MATDGHDETNSRFSQFCEKRLKTEVSLEMKQFSPTNFSENNTKSNKIPLFP
jgi:hypothetical protein